jgi:hypothetical protein
VNGPSFLSFSPIKMSPVAGFPPPLCRWTMVRLPMSSGLIAGLPKIKAIPKSFRRSRHRPVGASP